MTEYHPRMHNWVFDPGKGAAPPKNSEVATSTGADSGSRDESGGIKHDSDKPDVSLLPWNGLVPIARALEYGERKYARYNYRAGFKVTRLARAAIGHVLQWLWVEDLDPESGVSHLGHAGACVVMLLDILALGTATDNRDVARLRLTPTEEDAKPVHTPYDEGDREL